MRSNNVWAPVALLSGYISLAAAQLTTSCNPTTNTSCPVDVGLDTAFTTDFTKGENTSWVAATGTTLTYGSKGAEFTINKDGQAPTITTDFYFFFGYIEVKMRAAGGQGIISSIVLESDDLDEIDWEWLGGNNSYVETNYFGKGNTTSYDRAIYYPVDTPVDTFHTYGLNWTSEAIDWSIDGTIIRTLKYSDANGGKTFPQTPCKLAIGNWAGGSSSEANGTIIWAGGLTDFTKAPFTMYVESVMIQNHNPGKGYKWTDQTGDYTSIEVLNSTSISNSSSTTTSSSGSSVANPDGITGNSTGTSSSGSSGTTTTSQTTAAITKSGASSLGVQSTWISMGLLSIGFWFALL